MKVIKNLPKQSKEFQSFFKMWQKTWEKLYNNQFYKLLSECDIDPNDFNYIVKEKCEFLYIESKPQMKNYNTIKEMKKDLSKNYQDLIEYATSNFYKHINSYLNSHNIKLINTERNEWKTMRFMSNFLGDFNSSKIIFWHFRRDEESGEFVEFDKDFVLKCIKNKKIPDLPKNIKIPKKWKDVVEKWNSEILAKRIPISSIVARQFLNP